MKQYIGFILVVCACSFSSAEAPKAKPTFKQKVEQTLTKVSQKLNAILTQINIVGRFESFGKQMAKQNETVVENAAVGVHTQVAKRTVSSNEKVRKIQENLDKVSAEKIKKYDSLE